MSKRSTTLALASANRSQANSAERGGNFGKPLFGPSCDALLAGFVLALGISIWSVKDSIGAEVTRTATEPAPILVTGQGIPVCEAFRNYLHAVADQMKDRAVDELMCQRDIPRGLPGLSSPEWNELDPTEDADLAVAVENAVLYRWDENDPPKWLNAPSHRQAMLDGVRLRYRNNHDKWYRAKVDVDNDGALDQVIRYRRGRCGSGDAAFAIPILVLGYSGRSVNIAKTRQILQEGLTFETLTRSFDILVFGGKTYVNRWQNEVLQDGKPSGQKMLSVHLNERASHRLVCQYLYDASKRSK